MWTYLLCCSPPPPVGTLWLADSVLMNLVLCGVTAGGLVHQRTAVLGGKNTVPLTGLDFTLQPVIGVLEEY